MVFPADFKLWRFPLLENAAIVMASIGMFAYRPFHFP